MIQSNGYIIAKNFIEDKQYSGFSYDVAFKKTMKTLILLLKACETEQEYTAASFETKYIERLEKLNDALLERLNDTNI